MQHVATINDNMNSKHSIKKICEYCHNEFEANKLTTRYCSHNCNSKALKDAKRNEVIQLTVKLTKQKRIRKLIKDVSNQEYLSISEAAMIMSVSRWTIYRYVVDGKIESKRLSERTTRIKKIDLESFFDNANSYHVKNTLTEDKSEIDWYTLNEIIEKYGILRHQIRKIVNTENISEKKNGTRTLIAKKQMDKYFTKKGFDFSLKNLAEWYVVSEIMEKYCMTEQGVYVFVSRYKIPKKQLNGKRYYSKFHIDNLKNNKQ
jgi:excisionase family DNA binding protein